MKHNIFPLCLILVLATCALAQEATPAQSPAGAQAAAQGPNRGPIEAALKAYVSAYDRRSLDDLVAVWPDLPNQKKDYKKIKEFFNDGSISDAKLSIQPLEIQSVNNSAVAKCERIQEFVKTETHTQQSGDTMMSSPAQRPGNTQMTSKENKKKKDTVWIKLHKNGDNWQIVSITDKPQTP